MGRKKHKIKFSTSSDSFLCNFKFFHFFAEYLGCIFSLFFPLFFLILFFFLTFFLHKKDFNWKLPPLPTDQPGEATSHPALGVQRLGRGGFVQGFLIFPSPLWSFAAKLLPQHFTVLCLPPLSLLPRVCLEWPLPFSCPRSRRSEQVPPLTRNYTWPPEREQQTCRGEKETVACVCVCARARARAQKSSRMKDKHTLCKDKGVFHNIKIKPRIKGQHPSSSTVQNRLTKIIPNIRFNLLLKILWNIRRRVVGGGVKIYLSLYCKNYKWLSLKTFCAVLCPVPPYKLPGPFFFFLTSRIN